jgi:uncharacterized membrane protein YphA (DoxX/SURF4 family)
MGLLSVIVYNIMAIIFLIGRILFGGYFVMNGYNHLKNSAGMTGYAQSKGVPYPKAAIIGTGILLLLGGLGIVLGVFPRFAVLLLEIFLIPVTFKMHQYWKVTDPMQKMGEQINFTKNVALIGAALVFLAPWIYSISL